MEKIVYILIAMIPIGILTVICMAVAKKENAKLEDLLATMSPEELERLKGQNYSEANESKKLYETMGLVAAVKENGTKSVVHLLFYNAPRDEIYSQDKKVDSADITAKGIAKGAFIPCIMKLDEEYQIFVLKEIK